MGTNKARIDKNIKKILDGKTIDEARESIPEITSEIKGDFIAKEFSNQSCSSIVGGKLSKLHLDEVESEELISDSVKRELWINEIMELIEEETEEDMSDLLLKALKIALAETVKEEKDEIYFVETLLYQIVFLSLKNAMQGALETLEEGLTILQIQKEFIKPLADKIFEDDVKTNISKLVEGKITLTEMNEQISSKLKNFGGF